MRSTTSCEPTTSAMVAAVAVAIVMCSGRPPQTVLSAAATAEHRPTVTTDAGRVMGTILHSTEGRPYHAYRGMPYAKAARFQPPRPADHWNNTLDVAESFVQCPQFNFMVAGVDGQEDCLVINVYVPQISNKNKSLPVLFFIHGGGFVLGSGTFMFYGASRFMDKDVVLVTFNYRLGVLGFLSTADSAAPGNYGLLDQVMALRWVQRNIAQFGGDPNKVTLFGESAGAVAVTLLMLSPLSKGLFHAAIAQSGSALNYWAIQKDPLMWSRRIAEEVNCPMKNIKSMVECLKGVPYKDLVLTTHRFQNDYMMFPLNLLPVVERPSPDAFLPDSPQILLQEGRIASKVPIIIGINKDEGFPFYKEFTRGAFKRIDRDYFFGDFSQILASMVGSEALQMSKAMPVIQTEYAGNRDMDVERDLMRMLSDLLFGSGVSAFAEKIVNAGVPTYAYVYSFIGKHTFAEVVGGDAGTYCGHADELYIQFDFFYTQLSFVTANDKKMASILNTLWTNFADTKTPSLSGCRAVSQQTRDTFEWKPYNNTDHVHMQLHLNPEPKTGVLCSKAQFWNEVLPKIINKHADKEL